MFVKYLYRFFQSNEYVVMRRRYYPVPPCRLCYNMPLVMGINCKYVDKRNELFVYGVHNPSFLIVRKIRYTSTLLLSA